MTKRTLSLIAGVVAIAGVPFGTATAAEIAEPASGRPRVVVAVIDSAPNPYHEFFSQGGPLYGETAPSAVTPEVLAEFGIDESHIIDVTRTGDFQADFDADRAQFDAVAKGEPYWFRGTNIIGISFNDDPGSRLRPDGNRSAHGIGTHGSVLGANPEAIVLAVESPGSDAALYEPGYATDPIGETYAFNHPSVDFISTSYGPPFSPPAGYHLTESYSGVVENGKIHFGAADNSPALSGIDATAGPWWAIGIAGFAEGASEGKEPLSGSAPDFVGDWTQTLPYCRRCESGTSEVSGTSFATPTSAGVLSDVLLEARRAAGHIGGIIKRDGEAPLMVEGNGISLTNWELRRALEQGAYYPTIADYEPDLTLPVIDVAPWAEVGWGAITPDPAHDVVGQTLAHLGLGTPTRSKDAAACAFMTGNIEARHAYWDRVAQHSDSNGETADPYIAC